MEDLVWPLMSLVPICYLLVSIYIYLGTQLKPRYSPYQGRSILQPQIAAFSEHRIDLAYHCRNITKLIISSDLR